MTFLEDIFKAWSLLLYSKEVMDVPESVWLTRGDLCLEKWDSLPGLVLHVECHERLDGISYIGR